MSRRRKTNEFFLKEVADLTGEEYEFLEEYITALTKIRVKHKKCGNIYYIRPSEFLNGSRCPFCAGIRKKTNEEFLREHSFLKGTRCQLCFGNKLKTNEEFEEEIKKIVGKEYVFLEKYKNSRTKIKVQHKICGHVYKVRPSSFLRGDRCPKCCGNAKKTDKQFLGEVKKMYPNEEYTFLEEYKNGQKKIGVRHNKCGHIYKVKPVEFLNGVRCPKCYGTPKKTHQRFLEDVKKLVGDEYVFLEPYKTNKTKMKIKHNVCGNTYEVRPDSFFSGRRCPYCKSSKGEKEIAKRLKKRHIKFLTEKTFAGLKDNISLRFDFYLPDFNLVIEYDGRQHFEPVTFGGVSEEKAKENFIKAKKRDCIKNNYCKENGIRLIRISFSEFENIGEILDKELLSLRG